MEEHEELLLFIKEELGLTDPSKDEIEMMRKTFWFQRWRLRRAYADFAKAMRETIAGSFIMKIIEFLNKCFERIFP